MGISYGDWKEMQDKLDLILKNQSKIIAQGASIMATGQQLGSALAEIKTDITTYISGRDAIDEDLKQQIKDLADQHVTDTTAKQALQDAIDSAFDSAQDDIAALTPASVQGAQGSQGSQGSQGPQDGSQGSQDTGSGS